MEEKRSQQTDEVKEDNSASPGNGSALTTPICGRLDGHLLRTQNPLLDNNNNNIVAVMQSSCFPS